MKKGILILLTAFITISGFGQINNSDEKKESNSMSDIMNKLYGNNKNKKAIKTAENVAVFSEWLIYSLENYLYFVTEYTKRSSSRMGDDKLRPGLVVGESFICFESNINEMGLRIKRSKVKQTLLFENYRTARKTKIKSMKIISPLIYNNENKDSKIGYSSYNPSFESVFIFLEETKYKAIAIPKGEDVNEFILSLDFLNSSGGFLLQIGHQNKYEYDLVGLVESGCKVVYLFNEDKIERFKNLD